MFPIYEEQRTKLAEATRLAVKTASDTAASQISFAVDRHVEQQAYLVKVTEDYFRIGYLHIEGSQKWTKCGEFANSRSYLGKLAKDMGRQLIVLESEPPRPSTYRDENGWLGDHWYRVSRLSLPNVLFLAPIYAALELVALEPGVAWNETKRPGVMHVTKDNTKSRRSYTLINYTSGAENCTVHPLVTHFIEQAATDPVVRQLLKIT